MFPFLQNPADGRSAIWGNMLGSQLQPRAGWCGGVRRTKYFVGQGPPTDGNFDF